MKFRHDESLIKEWCIIPYILWVSKIRVLEQDKIRIYNDIEKIYNVKLFFISFSIHIPKLLGDNNDCSKSEHFTIKSSEKES